MLNAELWCRLRRLFQSFAQQIPSFCILHSAFHLSCLIQLICLAEQGIADDEQHHQHADGQVCILQLQTENIELHAGGDLVDETNQRHAEKRCALAADIHEAIKFAALLGRHDLAQIAAGKGLDRTLEHAHQGRQQPELPLGHQEHRKDRDAGVANDADLHQLGTVMLGRKSAENNGTGEGHDLGQQQSKEQARGIQAQGRAVGGSHVDNGVNTVDKEEESE